MSPAAVALRAVEALLLCAAAAAAPDERFAAALKRSSGTTEFDYAVLYASCRAYAAQEPSECAALAPYTVATQYRDPGKRSLKRPDRYDFLCLSNLYDLRMSAAAIRRDRGAMAEACEAHEAIGHDDFRKESVREACGLLAAYSHDPERACAKIAPLVSRPDALAYCRSELHVFMGVPDSCGEPGLGPVGQEVCTANAAYRRAHHSKDPTLCGDSLLCRVHAGGGPAGCEPYLEHLEGLACRRRRPARECGLSRLDKDRLAQADVWLEQAEGLVAGLERGPCSGGFSLDALRSTFSQRRLPEGLSDALFQSVAPELERFYQCRAIVEDGPEACSGLAAFSAVIPREDLAKPLPMDLMCKTLFYEARLAKSLQAGNRGEVASYCVTRNRLGDRDFKLESLDRSCGVLAQYAGDTAATCGALEPYFDNATIRASCPRMLRYATGDATVCTEFRDPIVHERCLGYAAYRQGACGGSAYCRSLQGGGPGVCASYEKKLMGVTCAFFSLKNLGGRLPALFADIAEVLSENDPEGTAGWRAAKLAALRARLNKLSAPGP